MLRALHEADIADQSVIIVTADHGGHDKTHGLSIPDDMNIPWIVWGKGVKKDFEITAPVNHVRHRRNRALAARYPAPRFLDGKPVTSAFE